MSALLEGLGILETLGLYEIFVIIGLVVLGVLGAYAVALVLIPRRSPPM